MTSPRPFLDRAVALAYIVRAQADPATATAYLGDEPEGLEAELDGLAQPWLATLRVVVEEESIVGACAIEWDEETAMAWIQGPWVAPERFGDLGELLVRAVAEQCPPSITRLELCAELAHTGMAELSDRLGWTATRASHAMVIPAGEVADWVEVPGVRAAREGDLVAVTALHEDEFAGAYATARQLLSDYVTLVAEWDDRVVGYAAGQLQDDGQAYIDFMAVDPAARGRGVGRGLLGALAHRLVSAGRPGRLHLTVDEQRAPAIALYESLGMRRETSIRGYRGSREL